jgi:acetylornithine deacetylase/succinyl-diaminopimelate desuccinylase-like protein
VAADDQRFAALRRLADEAVPAVADLAEQICLIPAPSYEETERAHFVAAELERRGLETDIDEVGNVYARRTGRGEQPSLMLAAHTDTVFPRETPLTVTRRDGELVGPSIGDNSLGVAAMLELLSLLDRARIETPGDLLFVANVGEEGLGNLRGIRAAVDRYAGELGGVIAIEGHNLGRVTHMGVGSKRIRAIVHGPGGHSWGAYGEPSAIHELCAAVAEMLRISVPSDPKTTFNVGIIEGGVSVNTIAPRASAVIDMRSVDPEALARLASEVERIVLGRATALIRTEIEVLGERPAGRVSPSAPIVQAAADILTRLGIEPTLNASSTDANIPIARGIPAICVGVTRGSGTHRVEESIQLQPIGLGMLQLALLASEFPVG